MSGDPVLFELDGLFASVDTIATTPIDELDLPREPAADRGDQEPKPVTFRPVWP